MDDEAVHEELHAARFGWSLAGSCPLYARWWSRSRQADLLLVHSTERAVAVRTPSCTPILPLDVRRAGWLRHDFLLGVVESLLQLPDPPQERAPLRLRLAALTASERVALGRDQWRHQRDRPARPTHPVRLLSGELLSVPTASTTGSSPATADNPERPSLALLERVLTKLHDV